MTDQVDYFFDDVEIIGQGVMASGIATLCASCPDVDKSQFYVESIEFYGPDTFNRETGVVKKEPNITIHRKQIEEKRAALQEFTLQEAIFWHVAQLLEKDESAQEVWDSHTWEYD